MDGGSLAGYSAWGHRVRRDCNDSTHAGEKYPLWLHPGCKHLVSEVDSEPGLSPSARVISAGHRERSLQPSKDRVQVKNCKPLYHFMLLDPVQLYRAHPDFRDAKVLLNA